MVSQDGIWPLPSSHRADKMDFFFSVLLVCPLEESLPHENPELDLGLWACPRDGAYLLEGASEFPLH